MKTVKLFFPKDAYYNDPTTPLYNGGGTYDIPESMATRWIKRGAIVVKGHTEKLEKPNPQVPTPVVEVTLPVDPSGPDAKDEEPVQDVKPSTKKSK